MKTSTFSPSFRVLRATLWAAIFLLAGRLHAQNVFSGIWSPSHEGRGAWITSDWNGFTTQWAQFEKNGLLLDDFEVYLEGSTPVYVGLFKQGTGRTGSWFVADWDSFTAQWEQFEKDGLRMHDFETYVVNGVRWYAGIFHEGTGGSGSWFTTDWNDFTRQWDEFEKGGLRMHDFEAFEDHGVVWYAGIFREGTGASGSWFTADWNDFVRQWGEFEKAGLRLKDFEFWKEGGTWIYGGIFRPGTGGSYSWFGADWQNFQSFWHEREKEGYGLDDIEIFPTSCSNACSDLLILPKPDYYNYGITQTDLHCEGVHGTCPPAFPDEYVYYRAPFYEEGGERFVKLSAVMDIDPIFTLPFTNKGMTHNGWLYSPDPVKGKQWHHAIDYSNGSTFDVRAAAPGTVIFVGWDKWSGNTVVISHDVGGDTDRYRTIYMHLRNGASNDCKNSWDLTIPELAKATDDDGKKIYANYKAYLTNYGCNSDGSGTPDAARWGSEYDTIKVVPGQYVERGAILAKAGCTGPGGCGCTNGGNGPNTHLHIFFAHRDPTDDLWHTFDPYGIYGEPQCYPTHGNADGASSATACARYPIAWLGGRPQLPPPPPTTVTFKKGDSNDDGKIDISDAISLLGCQFLGAACPHCDDAADANSDGRLDLSDAIFTLTCLFQEQCGVLSVGGSCQSHTLRLGCRGYESCPPPVPR